ncbi:DUF3054 domain-containing protein [Nocardioides sp. TRM66260-LWL]|uniref:DUF3054 domain-containing protein n=1 Tax=Nocardioides sp. TRM66260-LWL TaxID=2874478 RepID=UPI001CC7D64A|nr:DUF3054 domain-containing protein [Nocardioides sp. TRM66260-LWL]MBZ5735402.1 DUF3054 domain-containing protein [Nocardioides sp. TRM66260-LWL]
MRFLWLPVDVALVLLFAAIGRSSHEEGLTLLGTLETAGPFLVGVALAWAVLSARSWAGGGLVAGLLVWPTTVIVGMGVRRLVGEGTATSFVVVATIVLAVLLVGSRLVAHLVRRRTGRAAHDLGHRSGAAR